MTALPPHFMVDTKDFSTIYTDDHNVALTPSEAWNIYFSEDGIIKVRLTDLITSVEFKVRRRSKIAKMFQMWINSSNTKNNAGRIQFFFHDQRLEFGKSTTFSHLGIGDGDTIYAFTTYDKVASIIQVYADPELAKHLANLHRITDTEEDLCRFSRILSAFL